MSILLANSGLMMQGGYSAAVQAVLSRFTGANALTGAEIAKIQIFVDGMVADSIWDKLDDFWWVKGIGSKAKSLIGFKSRTAVEMGTVPFDPTGWGGFSTSNYIKSGFNPTNVGSQNWKRNNACVFGVMTGNYGGVACGGGALAIYTNLRYQSGNCYLNCVGAGTGQTSRDMAVKSLVRVASNKWADYIDGSKGDDISATSSVPPDTEWYIGCINVNGPNSPYSGKISAIGMGSAIGIDQTKLKNRILTLLS